MSALPVEHNHGLPLYVHVRGRHECTFERQDFRGTWVPVQEGRRAMNHLMSELVGLKHGSLTPEQVRAYRHAGDLERIWEIIGTDKYQNGHRLSQDIFQRLGSIMTELALLRQQVTGFKNAEATARDRERLPPPIAILPPPETPCPAPSPPTSSTPSTTA